jgi:hypothetical protein
MLSLKAHTLTRTACVLLLLTTHVLMGHAPVLCRGDDGHVALEPAHGECPGAHRSDSDNPTSTLRWTPTRHCADVPIVLLCVRRPEGHDTPEAVMAWFAGAAVSSVPQLDGAIPTVPFTITEPPSNGTSSLRALRTVVLIV